MVHASLMVMALTQMSRSIQYIKRLSIVNKKILSEKSLAKKCWLQNFSYTFLLSHWCLRQKSIAVKKMKMLEMNANMCPTVIGKPNIVALIKVKKLVSVKGEETIGDRTLIVQQVVFYSLPGLH